MGAFDKFLSYMKIDGDEDIYDDDYLDEPELDKKPVQAIKEEKNTQDEIKKPVRMPSNNKNQRRGVPTGMEVVRVEPSSVEDGRKISDLLLENKVVFLDLEGIDMNLAQRIIDFTSGATYAIDGTLQQMSKYTFVIAPPVVAVSGDFQDALSNNASVTF